MKKHKHDWVKQEGGGYKCRVAGCSAEKPSRLQVLTDLAKWLIIVRLKEKSPQPCKTLQKDVIDRMAQRETRDGDVVHNYQPIQQLAFIRAYKELEEARLIKIDRPAEVPFPATDHNTIFSLFS